MIHPDTELRFVSPEVGYGVFATSLIPKGTLTWVLDPLDQLIDPDRVRELGPRYEKLLLRYAYVDLQGKMVLSWDHGRYVNHSCESNAAGGGHDDFEIALRDIQPGEQVTDDYAELDTEERFACRCGAPTCRGIVGPVGREPVRERLAAAVREALRVAHDVAQPLREFARHDHVLRHAIRAADPRGWPPSAHAETPVASPAASLPEGTSVVSPG